MTQTQKPTDVAVLKTFFFEGVPAAKVAPEMKRLTHDERAQLAQGIRDGSLTY